MNTTTMILTTLAILLVLGTIIWTWNNCRKNEKEGQPQPSFSQGIKDSKPAEVEEQAQSRYVEKKQSKAKRDINRWGRWSCTLKGGKVVTKVGMLSSVTSNANVISYREIK